MRSEEVLELRGNVGSEPESPGGSQKRLRNDRDEFQKSRENERQDAFCELRETQNCSNRLAGAMEKDIPGHP
mgnify:CR=1 FL=1